MDAAPAIDWEAVWHGDFSTAVCHANQYLAVADIAGKGRGVIATKGLTAGDLLLAERAVATAPEPQLAEVTGVVGVLALL